MNAPGLDLWGEILNTMEALEWALRESRKRGNEWAQANAEYYTVKSQTAFRLRDEGMSASMIALVLKGDKAVNMAMLKRDAAEVSYENAREARNIYKKRLDTLREQMAREWTQSGMTN